MKAVSDEKSHCFKHACTHDAPPAGSETPIAWMWRVQGEDVDTVRFTKWNPETSEAWAGTQYHLRPQPLVHANELAAERERSADLPRTWGDDIALMGPDAPQDNGRIDFLIEYLMTVRKRFGKTCTTHNLSLQWGATALHKQDRLTRRAEQAEARAAELERALETCINAFLSIWAADDLGERSKAQALQVARAALAARPA